MSNILHIANNAKLWQNKFVPNYSKLICNRDEYNTHSFAYIGDNFGLSSYRVDMLVKNNLWGMLKLIFFMLSHEKIIFHTYPNGISSIFMSIFISLPILRGKSYAMVLWGGEVHFQNSKTIKMKILRFFQLSLMKKMNGFITYLEEDYNIACKLSGNRQASFLDLGVFYPSNIVDVKSSKIKNLVSNGDFVNVLLGSSALERNNHKIIIDNLSKIDLSNKEVKFFIPLSYGDLEYGQFVENYAMINLGTDNVIIMKDFMNHEDYVSFLSKIDVAIFGHLSQQGMGNILTLLGLGSKVHLNMNSISWSYLSKLGFFIFDYENINLSKGKVTNNSVLAEELFSLEKTINEQIKYYSMVS